GGRGATLALSATFLARDCSSRDSPASTIGGMIPALLVGSATLPAALVLWYLYRLDEHPTPREVVLKCFLLGMIVSVPVLPVATALSKLGNGSAVPEAVLA